MGKFIYEGSVQLTVEDRALKHLQSVINSKLRRGEPFPFSWRDDTDLGDARTSVWLHPNASLVFKFTSSRFPALNPAWIDALAYVANSPSGLYVVPEPLEQSGRPTMIDDIL